MTTDWKSFSFEKVFWGQDNGEEGKLQKVWLPEENYELHEKQYVEFDTLVHVTAIEKAGQILKQGIDRGLQPEKVNDGSVMCHPDHPLKDLPVIIYRPDTVKRLRTPGMVTKRNCILSAFYFVFGRYGPLRQALLEDCPPQTLPHENLSIVLHS